MTVSLRRHVSGVSAPRVTPGDWRKGGGGLGKGGINKFVIDANVVFFGELPRQEYSGVQT